jgi:hypothetical protein
MAEHLREPVERAAFPSRADDSTPHTRTVDFHEFNRGGAISLARRTFLNLDREKTYHLKFIVGIGLHSAATGPVIGRLVREVAVELGFEEPQVFPQNQGHLVLDLAKGPPKSASKET